MKELIEKFQQRRIVKDNTKKLEYEERLNDKERIIELQQKIIGLYENRDKLKQKNKELLAELKKLRGKKVKDYEEKT
jgi:hypothetical protein